MAKFGWCLSNLHMPADGQIVPGQCPGRSGTLECDCECHNGKEMWIAPNYTLAPPGTGETDGEADGDEADAMSSAATAYTTQA